MPKLTTTGDGADNVVSLRPLDTEPIIPQEESDQEHLINMCLQLAELARVGQLQGLSLVGNHLIDNRNEIIIGIHGTFDDSYALVGGIEILKDYILTRTRTRGKE